MNDHVGKPIEPLELWATLRRWLPSDGVRSEVKTTAAVGLPDWRLPGIDLASGLRRVLGKQQAYLGLLGKFAKGQRQFVGQLRQALGDGDRERAERLAHSLRGLAGNLGAAQLQAQAGELERGIHQGRAWPSWSARCWSWNRRCWRWSEPSMNSCVSNAGARGRRLRPDAPGAPVQAPGAAVRGRRSARRKALRRTGAIAAQRLQ